MKVYRNRWYILDSSIINIIAHHLVSEDYDILQRIKHSYIDSAFVRAAMYPDGPMPQIKIKIIGPEYLNYFQLLRGAEFTIEQAAVWWAWKGNKKFKIEPGLTGAVSGAFLEDVPNRLLATPRAFKGGLRLQKVFNYMNAGYKVDTDSIMEKLLYA